MTDVSIWVTDVSIWATHAVDQVTAECHEEFLATGAYACETCGSFAGGDQGYGGYCFECIGAFQVAGET